VAVSHVLIIHSPANSSAMHAPATPPPRIVAIESLGVDCRHVQRDEARPTGTVAVSLSPAGDASFEFAADVAWDHLAWEPALAALAADAGAVCFGTLGQRSEISRLTIRRFLAAARGIRVFDVNLRQHFHSPGLIRESLAMADVLKLNDEELPVVAAACGIAAADPVAALGELAARHGLRLVFCSQTQHRLPQSGQALGWLSAR
jgi:fructokinase